MVYKRTPRDPADCQSCANEMTLAEYKLYQKLVREELIQKEREERAQRKKDSATKTDNTNNNLGEEE